MKKSLIILFAALVIFAGCFNPFPDNDIGKEHNNKEPPFDPQAAALTENVRTDGYLGTADKEQWFKFTASANLHFIHIILGALSSKLNVQLYDSEGKTIGNRVEISDFSSSAKYVSYSSFTAGKEYYVKVERGNLYSGEACKYIIALNTSAAPPLAIKLPSNAIQLNANTFADGNIPASDGEQWFKFTSNAAMQYIHVIFDTLKDLHVQLYKVNNGISVIPFGTDTELFYTTKSAALTLNVNEEYYIRVYPHNSYDNKGAYKIAFSELFISPAFEIKQLTEGAWADGNITTNGEVQWFKFTATDTSQYIHASFGTMSYFTGLKIQLYDNNGAKVGDEGRLYVFELSPEAKYAKRTLNKDQVYFINVYTDSNLGTYKIAFNKSTTPPTL
jgi:hypothetical protein